MTERDRLQSPRAFLRVIDDSAAKACMLHAG
jgi:hypothetical protein